MTPDLGRSGRYYTSATDFAIVYPILELAGGRLEMVEDVLYVYNLHDGNTNASFRGFREQRINCAKIRRKRSYAALAAEPHASSEAELQPGTESRSRS